MASLDDEHAHVRVNAIQYLMSHYCHASPYAMRMAVCSTDLASPWGAASLFTKCLHDA